VSFFPLHIDRETCFAIRAPYVSIAGCQNGRTIWITDAHRDGKRFIVHADEKLSAFVELEICKRILRRRRNQAMQELVEEVKQQQSALRQPKPGAT
jgi:hypothetical protein